MKYAFDHVAFLVVLTSYCYNKPTIVMVVALKKLKN